ncbi:MAG TPA: hydrogenase expression/formation protein HypE, partial [Anaerolineales bacterium]|nr:hydrogenase expression/formation protein HypE [Anaerolineales bacterium]
MSEETVNIEGAVCAPPLTHNEQIVMGHGAGGHMSHQLIQQAFISAFDNRALRAGDDAARLESSIHPNLAISTDSHVVFPLFFPGGDIGRLAVCGTV